VANLLIDIGNTALKAAWADGITLGRTFRYQGEKMIDFILSLTSREKPEIMVLSSVRKFNNHDIAALNASCERLVILDESVYARYSVPSYITADRAASIIASRYLFSNRGCTIIDFGTMLATDYLDKNGNYEGGCISPGLVTRFKSVNRYSRNLPLLEIPEETCDKGLSLSSSIESGVVSGIIFEIEGRICQNPENIVVFTGGDANYFAKRMKNSIFVVCNLILMGLALIAVEYDNDN
jgi:type III pantothenate kinase